jgi:lipopolysaccharide/colanic/teichoic acid biosynthesis glycosyltransferase
MKPPDDDLAKRIFDLVAATVLVVLLAPMVLAVAAVIKLTTGAPVVFRQVRIGRRGRPFVIYKFRTMHRDAASYGESPSTPRDARVTAVGRLLRATSLDELPQLLNVIKGEMSLVGPRPEMPFLVGEYDAFQRLRLEARPGMTGLWQVATDRRGHIHDKLKYDLYYVYRRSWLLDLALIVRTIPVCGRGLAAIRFLRPEPPARANSRLWESHPS